MQSVSGQESGAEYERMELLIQEWLFRIHSFAGTTELKERISWHIWKKNLNNGLAICRQTESLGGSLVNSAAEGVQYIRDISAMWRLWACWLNLGKFWSSCGLIFGGIGRHVRNEHSAESNFQVIFSKERAGQRLDLLVAHRNRS